MSRTARIFIFAALASMAAATAFGGWTRSRRLSQPPGNSQGARIAVSGAAVHVIWLDDSEVFWKIQHARSFDCGETWSTAVPIAAAENTSILEPVLAVSGSTVHVVWKEYEPAGRHRIYYSGSVSAGESWSPPTLLSSAHRGADAPSIAVSGDTVLVAWSGVHRGDEEAAFPRRRIHLRRSFDSGGSWEPARKITRRVRGLTGPLITAAGNRVHLVWGHNERIEDGFTGEIFYRRSENEGSTWTAKKRINETWGSWPTALEATEESVHVLWRFSGGYKSEDVFYKGSRDRGETWSGERQVNPAESDGSGGSLAVEEHRVHYVWVPSWIPSSAGILTRRSPDGGVTMLPEKRLAYPAGSPAIDVVRKNIGACSGTAHVVFTDRRPSGGTQISYRRRPRRLP